MVITLLILCVLVGFLLGDTIVSCRRIVSAFRGRDWKSLPEPMNVYAAGGLWALAVLIWVLGFQQSVG